MGLRGRRVDPASQVQVEDREPAELLDSVVWADSAESVALLERRDSLERLASAVLRVRQARAERQASVALRGFLEQVFKNLSQEIE